MILSGMKVIVDDSLAAYELIRRSWSERFFTRPWRPWRSHKKVFKDEPPPYWVNHFSKTIYTTSRGYDALNKVIDRIDIQWSNDIFKL